MKSEDFAKYKKKLPDSPGVYVFYGPRGKVLYIGKATSLRDRVRSYFGDDLIVTRGPLLVDMVTKAKRVKGIPTDSVLEALLLEAELIRRHQPIHNTELKDDKSFNYLVITKEEYPRLVVVRGHDLPNQFRSGGTLYQFGPFPHGGQFKEALRLIRRIFPFRATCIPGQGRPCFDAQIGLCPGVCTGNISSAEYRKTIRHIALLFQGKKKKLVRTLEREMKTYAKREEFEKAAKIRASLFGLQHIQDVSLIKDEFRNATMYRTVRIEAYDVAHISGTNSVGVMTVVEGGEAKRSDYRKFRIRAAAPGSDTDALKEVIARRLGHNEWPLPRLIVVDGAAAQMNAAKSVLEQYGVTIPIVGVVKDERHRPKRIVGLRTDITGREADILLANAEAHRFGVSYHRKLRSRL